MLFNIILCNGRVCSGCMYNVVCTLTHAHFRRPQEAAIGEDSSGKNHTVSRNIIRVCEPRNDANPPSPLRT